jgi:hypothetical protein
MYQSAEFNGYKEIIYPLFQTEIGQKSSRSQSFRDYDGRCMNEAARLCGEDGLSWQ